jgi:hypothetical protein
MFRAEIILVEPYGPDDDQAPFLVRPDGFQSEAEAEQYARVVLACLGRQSGTAYYRVWEEQESANA